MRLTLRTLLAYLDDRLPPGQAKEIGQKVTTSPFATELAERIRSVVRRRRLAREAVGQKSIDANLIAEYLDDQLTPELVALIERQILSSDATLAEVAATHQIIGTLKDPVELADSLKERLYRLGPQPDEEESKSDVAAHESSWKPLQAQAVRQKRSPMLLLGAMTLGWLALVATDSALFLQSATSNNNSDVVAQPQPADVPEIVEPQVADVDPAPDISAGTDILDPPLGAPILPPVDNADPSTSADAASTVDGMPVDSAPALIADGNVDSSVADAAAMDAVATDSPTTAAVDNADPPTTAVNANAQRLALNLIDSYGMTVRLADDSKTWTWAAKDITGTDWASLLSASVVGIAAPFDVQLQSPELSWQVTLQGPTLFRTAVDGAAVQVIDGDLVLRQLDTGNPPSAFTVECGNDQFQVTVPELTRSVGVSVHPLPVELQTEVAESTDTKPQGFLPVGRPCQVTVYAADAPAIISIGDQQVTVPAGMQLQWQTGSGVLPIAETSVIPDWVFEVTKQKTESTNELLADTATAFRSATSVATAADTLLDSRNPLMARYSVNLPGLTRQLDLLCSTLLSTEETVVRQATIVQLQNIQATSPGARERLNELLRSRLPEIDTENAMKMLVGISPVAAEDRNVSEWLVDMLNNSRAPLRELAIHNLKTLTGLTENFMADDDPGRRSSAVKRWIKLLDRNNGRLLPGTN